MSRLPKMAQTLISVLSVGLFVIVIAVVFRNQQAQPGAFSNDDKNATPVGDNLSAYPVPVVANRSAYPGSDMVVEAVVAPTQPTPRVFPTEMKYVFYRPPNGERIVFLTSAPEFIETDLFVSLSDLEARGITVVANFDEIKKRFEDPATAPQAVIFHRVKMKDVDPDWLKKIYPTGLVFASVNQSDPGLWVLVGDEYNAKKHNPSNAPPPTLINPPNPLPYSVWEVIYYKAEGTPEQQQESLKQGDRLGSGGGDFGKLRDIQDLDTFLSTVRNYINTIP